ncbi:MAG: hypothetical protein H0X37_09700 [Herpetosiphonaceae bacterium]|nr:hypothetical protein [Herpetosiphonaceae bacterium]
MLNTLWAVVREGRIEVLEHVDLPEGATLLVTLLPDEDTHFWLGASQASLDSLWANDEDDVYAELLQD